MTHAISKRHRFFVPLIILATPPLVQAATDCTTVTEIPQVECEALVALYTNLDGANWESSPSNGWNQNDSPCNWWGVSCTGSPPTNVKVIHLYERYFSGSLPTELGHLSSLEELVLQHFWNDTNSWDDTYSSAISGTIPTELGNLTQLRILDLRHNSLSGSIPSQLGKLANLEELSLRNNYFHDTSIPVELGNLTNLQTLDFSHCNLTGSIPTQLGDLSSLKILDLGYNNLSGSIPAGLGKLSNLEYLRLSGCYDSSDYCGGTTTDRFSGSIPTEFGNLTNLKRLYLDDNQLTGDIPSSFIATNLPNLTEIRLECNQLTASDTNVVAFLDSLASSGWTSQGESCSSNAVPNVPTNLITTTISQTAIDLTWLDRSNIETGFIVKREGIAIATPTTDTANYSDTGLTCNTTYNYSVIAANSFGDSAPSSTMSGTTSPCTPTDFTATQISTSQIDLNWTDVADETSYIIEREGTQITTIAADTTSYSDSGLFCGTTYSYSIKATNANGDSTAVTASATTLACSTLSGRVSLPGITLFCNDCTINNAAPETVEAQPVDPDNYVFLQGLVGFELTNIVNPQAHLVIYFHNINSLDNFIYRKYGPTTPGDPNSANWYNFSNVTIGLGTLDGQTMLKVNLTLADGVFGDDTGVDGRIVDAGGIARAIVTTPPTAVSTPLCTMSDSDIINTSCNAGEQTFTKEVKVEENSSVARATFESDVDNKGMISNSTVGADATLTGGKLTGTIINEGTVADVEFVGMELSGGTLSGTITNNSKVGGIIKDVKLAAGTTLKGGKLGGEITGDPDDPPLITAAQIMPGSILSNVRLSPTVKLSKDVVLGEGVILPSEPPTLADFGLAPEDIAKLDAEALGDLEPAVFGTLSAEDIKTIPPEAFVALKPAQIAEVQKAALEGLTTEQFEQTPIKTLGGLTSENMGGLPIEVIKELTPKHLDALDVKEFKAMPSEDVAKLFTNLDSEKITPQNVKKLVPNRWQLNLETGALTPPVGAKVSFQSLPAKRYSSNEANDGSSGTNNGSSGAFSLPQIPNLKSGFGIGGSGTPLMENTERSLEEENLTDFVLSQDENGILLVEGTGESAGILYTFIPDADNAIQVDTDKIPIGLSTSSGGFYTITTPDGIQYKVIPAPKNPVALSALFGGTEVVIGERGDTLVELPTKTRRGGARQVLIFDPFVEPAPEDICVEVAPGETFCEFDNAPEHIQRPGLHLPTGNTRRARAGEQAKVVYPDGTAQTVRPTVLSPKIFIQEGMKIDGVERMLFKANGLFYAFYQGNHIWIRPNFEVKTETVEVDGAIAPSITPNGKGGLTYTIAIDEPAQTRRGGARQILIFDPFIEPAPEELCVELETGETFCEFDNAAEHVQPKRD